MNAFIKQYVNCTAFTSLIILTPLIHREKRTRENCKIFTTRLSAIRKSFFLNYDKLFALLLSIFKHKQIHGQHTWSYNYT